jgi:type I restriction enzyme S subunit
MSEVNLPEEWCIPSFNDAVLNVNGARKPVSLKVRESIKGQFPYYGATGQIDSLNDFTHEGEHILIGEDGANLLSKSKDLAFIVDGQFWVNNHAHAIKCLAGVPTKFIANYINSLDLTPWVTGSAQPKLTKGNLEKIPTPLPPLAEQKVIAAKLDTLLAQVGTTKARLDRIPNILKSFRQSVLAAAVSGKLTEEWRSIATIEPCDYLEIAVEERKLKGIREKKHSKVANIEEIPFEIPHYWQWFRLGNLALKITDGAHNTPKVISEGFPYIMAKDLTLGFLDFSERRYISEKEHRELYLKCIPERDDLLVVNIGAGTGNNVLVDVNFEFSFKNIAIIKRPSFILGKYLKLFFDSQKLRIFDEQTRGGAQPFLSLTVLNDLAFALPPLEEQTEIVRRVEELFAFADTIEQKTNTALERVNNLTQSILAKAFRGELTADWRAENPDLISGENSAEALLAKIQAERDKLALEKKAANKTRKKKA